MVPLILPLSQLAMVLIARIICNFAVPAIPKNVLEAAKRDLAKPVSKKRTRYSRYVFRYL